MAKIGLKNFLFGVLTEDSDGTPTYGVAHKPAKAISCQVNITNNSAKLFADDALAESDTSFQSGTVTLGIDEENDEMLSILLGHAYADGMIVRGSNDVAPYVGLGRIITKVVNGVYKYKVEFLHKVKFSEPSQDNTTKGENLEFGTSTIEGQVATLADGTWSLAKTFNAFDDAYAFLESMFEAREDATVTFNLNGGTGTIPAVDTYVGAIITVPDGEGITPPTDETFIGWDSDSSATIPDVVDTYYVRGNITLYAIYESNN